MNKRIVPTSHRWQALLCLLLACVMMLSPMLLQASQHRAASVPTEITSVADEPPCHGHAAQTTSEHGSLDADAEPADCCDRNCQGDCGHVQCQGASGLALMRQPRAIPGLLPGDRFTPEGRQARVTLPPDDRLRPPIQHL